MAKLLYPELSYKIVGILYKVFNELGCGLQERYYQKAIKLMLQRENFPFLEQVRVDLELYGKTIGRYYIDFVVDQKIVLEIKSRSHFYRSDIQQILAYLKKSKIDLGLLARFGKDGVKIKRILRGF